MEKLIFGLLVAAIGLIIVFCVLGLLIALFTVSAKVFQSSAERKAKKQEAQAAKAAPAVQEAPVVQETVASDDSQIAAAIAAVIVAMESSAGAGLKVKSVRRVGKNTPAWNIAGRR